MNRHRFSRTGFASLLLVAVGGCARATPSGEPAPADRMTPWASTYSALPSAPTLIRNATVLTAAGPTLENADVLMRDGRIEAVGRQLGAAADVTVIDGTGRWVTPGLIDTHSHLGVYAAPGGSALSDGNEATNPNTAGVWAEHSVWPQDPQFARALAGGVTTLQILPGSANLFGGRSVTVKNLPGRSVMDMKFPGAPYGLKMACGENPKRVYGNRGGPSTRMGNVAGYRRAWLEAEEYRDQRLNGAEVLEDLDMETLAGVLSGDILVHNHCYRADEMLVMLDLAEQFGYRIASFHHAVEAYKIADVLAAEGVCASIWADWWGFKMEAYDGIQQNAALVESAGGCAVIHSDDPRGIQRLNHEAAKAMRAAWQVGMEGIDREDAIRWITINPARALGIDDQTGSLEVGRMADVVLWSGDPFSVYSHPERVWIDGAVVYDRNDPSLQPVSDFELGILPAIVD
ncbi:MAG TPA: amidohydrolase [Longimicrobiales bacterium]|nr:amidohydrolase [Longimicrobiales bacterium]